MLSLELAVLLDFQPIGRTGLVARRYIVAPLALRARQYNLFSGHNSSGAPEPSGAGIKIGQGPDPCEMETAM